jgi:hypothetical protein
MPDRGSTVYSEYITEQIAEQDARKESVEKRGLSVITTSGTLVSLLFGLVAVLTGADNYSLPTGAEPWLAMALVFFLIAALAGIVTNMPLLYLAVEVPELKSLLDSFWADGPEIAEKRVAATQLKVLARARSMNGMKGWILVGAVASELVAVAALALAIWVVLVHA